MRDAQVACLWTHFQFIINYETEKVNIRFSERAKEMRMSAMGREPPVVTGGSRLKADSENRHVSN